MRLAAPREVFAGLMDVGALTGGPRGDSLFLTVTRDGARMVGVDSANVLMVAGEVPARSFSRFDLPAAARENGGETVAVDTGKVAGFLRSGPAGKKAAQAEWSFEFDPGKKPGTIHLSTKNGEMGGRLDFAMVSCPDGLRKLPTIPPLDLPPAVEWGPEEWGLFKSAIEAAAEVSDYVALEVGERSLTVRAGGDCDGAAAAVEIPATFPGGWKSGARSLYSLDSYLSAMVRVLGKLRPESVTLTFREDFPLRMEARTGWGTFTVLLAPRVDPDDPRATAGGTGTTAPAPEPEEAPEEEAPTPAEVGEAIAPLVAALSWALWREEDPELKWRRERIENLQRYCDYYRFGGFLAIFRLLAVSRTPAPAVEFVRDPRGVAPPALRSPLPVAPIGPNKASPTPGPTWGGEAERAREGTPADVAGATPTAAPSPTYTISTGHTLPTGNGEGPCLSCGAVAGALDRRTCPGPAKEGSAA